MNANRLALETSPYLLQHAENPVHWRGWDADALTAARESDKPILLSIGYAACHWCHVMAHESFENPDIAAQMNENFINIKVDREERPDLDTIYQHALQLMGQQGGWPLTMFLTPAGEPFWGGTYFPPDRRHGRAGFPEILTAITEFYRDNRDGVQEHVEKLAAALAKIWETPGGDDIPMALIDEAARRLTGEFDAVHGGIGGAPKFPNPSILDLVWRYAIRTDDPAAKSAVLNTLDHMSQGGIYDHLGGGYARYSTDERWLVPHFEKMLYDNAQLMELLIQAWRKTGIPLYAQRVTETVGWVLREMVGEGGAFASTLDADSEGEEGRFYVWSAEELHEVLGDDATTFATAYGVSTPGNWEGNNILNRNHPAGIFNSATENAHSECRARLLARRARRTRPGWDDKILADWNGMMIAALADAGRTFNRPDWLAAAARAFVFVATEMTQDDRLYHSFRAGQMKQTATLDDYAFMARAAVALYEALGDETYIDAAADWFETLDEHYWDPNGGAYFFTADDAEALIVRTKSCADNATPSGNAIAAQTLAKLYFLTGDPDHRDRAQAIVTAFSGAVPQNFFPLAGLLIAAETLQATTQVTIIGTPEAPDTEALLHAAYGAPCPTRLISVLAPGTELHPEHPAYDKGQHDGAATAYVCVGATCSLPLTNPDALRQTLARD